MERNSRPAHETFHRVLLVVFTLLLGLGMIEIPALTGFVDYGRLIGIDASWLPRNRVPDPELRYTGRPYAHYTGSAVGGNALLEYRIAPALQTPYHWDVAYDSHGFRNPPGLESAEITVIGDSFVEGVTVPSDKLTTSVLARLQNVTVANLGQSGYGPQQELEVLKRFALPLGPRTIVWMFYEGNDLSDVEAYERAMHGKSSSLESIWLRSFSRNSLRRIWQLRRPAGARASGEIGGNTYFFDRQSAFSASPLSPAALKDLDTAARIISQAQELCTTQKCTLIVAFVPTAFRALHDSCEFPADSECRRWVPNDLPARFERALHAASPATRVLDLTPALSAAARNGHPPYYTDDAHWTEDGHAAAAAAIANYLAQYQIRQ